MIDGVACGIEKFPAMRRGVKVAEAWNHVAHRQQDCKCIVIVGCPRAHNLRDVRLKQNLCKLPLELCSHLIQPVTRRLIRGDEDGPRREDLSLLHLVQTDECAEQSSSWGPARRVTRPLVQTVRSANVQEYKGFVVAEMRGDNVLGCISHG
jgi:hypothetical protein